MQYDVIIIGAGPGGIFSAYELSKLCPDKKIGVFEEGQPLEKRRCPIDGMLHHTSREIGRRKCICRHFLHLHGTQTTLK